MISLLNRYFNLKFLGFLRGYNTGKSVTLITLLFLIVLLKEKYIILPLSVVFTFIFSKLNNSDFRFLLNYFERKKIVVLLVSEFTLFHLAVVYGLFLNGINSVVLWLYALFSVLLFQSTFNISYNKRSYLKFNVLPNHLYELKAFFRSKGYFFLLLLASFGLLFFDSLFFFFVYSLILMEFFIQLFSINENKEVVSSFFRHRSLSQKIFHYTIFSILCLIVPLVICLTISNKNTLGFFYILLYTVIYCVLILVNKYSNYTGTKYENNVFLAKNLYFFFCSITVIIGVIEIKRLYNNAQKNIENYVNS